MAAYEGNQLAAQAAVDLQLLNDIAEFHDPRPDPDRLRQLAERIGGQVLRSPADLTRVISSYQPARANGPYGANRYGTALRSGSCCSRS